MLSEQVNKSIIFDSRWAGAHGIGRFAYEVRKRLPSATADIAGGDPVSVTGLIELEAKVRSLYDRKRPQVFFSPGYVAPITWPTDFIFTIHDLIHIDVLEESSRFKTLYYNQVVRPAMHRAQRVLTVSEYSRRRLLEWSGVDESQVVVVGNGVDAAFTPLGPVHSPGYPYILYIRNNKPHKNVANLFKAFSLLKHLDLRLVLNGDSDSDLQHLALRLGIDHQIVFAGRISDDELPSYYRGAAVVTMPSLYEGFGLPPLEGMASGVPVVVSNVTSLPEVVGDAGVLVDPSSPLSISDGLEKALTDSELRQNLIVKGLKRAELFNWDTVAQRVRKELRVEDL